MPEFDRLAVVTIQGGGLFGLNLLGQLAHLTETVQVVPVAVAGNSAGSIVAALYWAGYTPLEIRDLFADMAAGQELSGLMAPFEPAAAPFNLGKFRSLKADVESFVSRATPAPPPQGNRLTRAVKWVISSPVKAYRGVRNGLTAYGLWKRVSPHHDTRGCFRGDGFVDKIDELIRNGPLLKGRGGLPTGQPLEFGDVRRLAAKDATFYAPALFLTATNVTGRKKLEVFNSLDEQYDRVPIAKAVRASAGFPVFFRPVEFGDERFAGWYSDGGIVSNYPAWIFSKAFRLRLLDAPEYRGLATRPWVHFGLRLERGAITDTPRDTSPKLFASSLARLVVGGEARSELEDRLENLVTRSFTIQLPAGKQLPPAEAGIPVPKDLLDIDAVSAELVREMYRLGQEESVTQRTRRVRRTDGSEGDRTADEKLDTGLVLEYTLPDRGAVEPHLSRLIERVLLVVGEKDNTRLLFRSNVFIPSGNTLHPRYAVNMNPPRPGEEGTPEANNDHDLQLRFDTGLTGKCLAERRLQVCNIGQLATLPPPVLDTMFGMTAEQHGRVRKDRTWLASVPIFDPFASYPRELSAPVPLPHAPFAHGLPGRTDGAVLGVLNLDARLEYDRLVPTVDPDARRHCTDPRIEAILHLMTATAAEVGDHLSRHFARLL